MRRRPVERRGQRVTPGPRSRPARGVGRSARPVRRPGRGRDPRRPRRRAANARTSRCSPGPSHWRSSMATRRVGSPDAIARRTSATARPTGRAPTARTERVDRPSAVSQGSPARVRPADRGAARPCRGRRSRPGQAGEGELCARRRSPARRRRDRRRAARRRARRPQRALADARLAVDDERRRTAGVEPVRRSPRAPPRGRRSTLVSRTRRARGWWRPPTARSPNGSSSARRRAEPIGRRQPGPSGRDASFPWFHGCGPRRCLPLMARHTHTPEAAT